MQQLMAHRKLSERQQMKIHSERGMHVYKRDDMIQKGRHKLSVREQKCVLYAISKIKPEDNIFQEYTFDLKDFINVCGFERDSYTELKAILLGLRSKCWWIRLDREILSAVSWFSVVRIHEKSSKVIIKFHEDMMPYLLKLAGQGEFYTHYELRYILTLRSRYAIRLYELLKSYHKNNHRWFFELDELKELLDCEKYVDFCDFRRRVLTPAVEEINTRTDIDVKWETEKEGRKVTRVEFFICKKDTETLSKTNLGITFKLEGIDIIAPQRALAAP